MNKESIRIVNKSDYKNDKIIEAVEEGNVKLICYEYVIPRPAVASIRELSKIYVMNRQYSTFLTSFRYQLINVTFCWLGLPDGPHKAYKAIMKNRIGIDLTDELNKLLDRNDLIEGIIRIPFREMTLSNIDKESYRELRNIFSSFSTEGEIIIGYLRRKRKHEFHIIIPTLLANQKEAILKSFAEKFAGSAELFLYTADEKRVEIDKIKSEGSTLILGIK